MGELKKTLMEELLSRFIRKKRGASPVFHLGHIVGRLEMALSNINAAQRKITDKSLDKRLSEAKKCVEEVLEVVRHQMDRLRGKD